MKVEVKIFAAVREVAGRESVSLELPAQATVADVRTALAEHFPQAAGLLQSASFAINQEYAADGVSIRPADEIACIPPVSGG